jgi:hypothetical protein
MSVQHTRRRDGLRRIEQVNEECAPCHSAPGRDEVSA